MVVRTACSILLLLSMLLAHGQGASKTLETDSGRVVLHYFSSGEVSTQEWTDPQGLHGRSMAFDRAGTIIFQHSTRSTGGHCTVNFSYHPDGALRNAEVDDAPQAGPQWYRSTSTFDEDGVRITFVEEGNDISPPGERPRLRTLDDTPLPEASSTVEGTPLFVNEVYVLNDGRVPCRIDITPRGDAKDLPARTFTLRPGETARVGHFVSERGFRSPVDVIVVKGTVTLNNGKPSTVGVLMERKQNMGPQQRAYYYQVAVGGSRVGFGF